MTGWFAANPVVTVILAVLVVYPLLMRALTTAVWPARAALADDLHHLENNPNLPSDARRAIAILGDHAFSWWIMPALALAFPVIVAERLIRPDAGSSNPLSNFAPETQARIDDAIWRFVLSAAATNPIFALLFTLEVFVVAIPQVVAAGIRRISRVFPVQRNRNRPRAATMTSGETLHQTLFNTVSRFDWFLSRLH